MNEANDELISAYVDERLSVDGRAAFEAQMKHDAPLGQRAQVTRLLTHTASQLEPLPLPRSFVLPASMAGPEKPARMGWDVRELFRLGSALAAALFVLLVGLDLSQMPGSVVVALTPSALTTFAPEASSAKSATNTSNTSMLPPELATQSTQMVVNTMAANEIMVAPAVRSNAQTTGQLLTATPAPAPIMTRAPMAASLTPVPTLASVVVMPASGSAWPLTRVLAGMTLIVGAALAVLGWRR